MFSTVRSGLVALAVVSGLFGASQASGVRILTPMKALATSCPGPNGQDLSSVSNERLSVGFDPNFSSKAIYSYVDFSTWCNPDPINWSFSNESSGAIYNNYSTQVPPSGSGTLYAEKLYVTAGVWWDAYACGPLNCTSNLRIRTT